MIKSQNREASIRKFTLVDQSNAQIRVTLWGNEVSLIFQKILLYFQSNLFTKRQLNEKKQTLFIFEIPGEYFTTNNNRFVVFIRQNSLILIITLWSLLKAQEYQTMVVVRCLLSVWVPWRWILKFLSLTNSNNG